MKRIVFLLTFMLPMVFAMAEQHRQQTEFELNGQLDANESYVFEASSYIKLLPGFKCDPNTNRIVSLSLDRYGVFPPENGLLGGPPNSSKDGVVGALPATLNVSDLGGAIYSIPIQLPKGIGDMTPDLAITYNNQAGNGLLGWAWSISGLSSITRTGTTKYHDGRWGSVKFDANDRFVMDGKRLMLSCQLAYGSDGATYRTEIDEMSKIVSHTTNAADGPDYFTVYKSDGTIWEYGNTSDSRVEPQNVSGPAMSWLVNKISDRDGNSIVFHYDEINQEGESYVNHIEYTLNENQGVNSMYDIVFHYKNRDDCESIYVYENLVKIKRLLDNITVNDVVSGKELLCYSFRYENTGNYNGNYHLYSKLCSVGLTVDGMKLNPTAISWYDAKSESGGGFQSFDLDENVFDKVPFTGDFNGDGITDVLLVPYKVGYSYQYDVLAEVYLSNGDGTFAEKPCCSFSFDKTLEWVYVADIDGDGLSDVVPYFCNYGDKSTWRSKASFYKNNGDLSFVKLGDDLSYDRFFKLYPGDLCAEKRAIFYFTYDNSMNSGTYYPCVVFYNGYRICQQTLGPASYEDVPEDIKIEDIDGDGRHEVIYLMADRAVVANLSYANKLYSYNKRFTDYNICSSDFLFSGDFNGDGNMDFLKFNGGNRWDIVVSDGKKFLSPVNCTTCSLLNGVVLSPKDRYSCSLRQLSSPSHTIRTADFDGDGKCDVALVKNFGGNYYFEIGFGLYKKSSSEFEFKFKDRYYFGVNTGHQYVHVGNFLGRENVSILGSAMLKPNAYRIAKIVALTSHNSKYSVKRVTDGLGNVHNFAYDYLVPYRGNTMYSFDFKWETSDIRTVGVPVRALKSDVVYSTNGKPCRNDYSYQNVWFHKYGHGIIGVQKCEITNYVNGKQKQRKCSVNELKTMDGYAIPLPSSESTFDADDKPITWEFFGFENYKCELNSKIVFPSLVNSEKFYFNIDGSQELLKKKFVINSYVTDNESDSYSNIVNLSATIEAVDTKDKGDDAKSYDFVTSTEYLYNNDAVNWVVNRVSAVKCSKHSKNAQTVGSCDRFVYDKSGNPFRVIQKISMPNTNWNLSDPLTVMTSYSYDKVGNIVEQTKSSASASSNRLTKVEFSPKYNYRYPTAIVNEKGWKSSVSYNDNWGLKSITTDYNGFDMLSEDDALGITSACSMPDGVVKIKTKRWSAGNKHAPENSTYYYWEKSTGKAESMVFFHRNGKELRNVTFGLNGEPIYVDMAYDDNDNMISRSLPYSPGDDVQYVYFIYDKYDRIIEEVFSNGLVHEYKYNGFEKTMTTVTPDNQMQSKKEVTNAVGWVVSYTDIGGNEITYKYYSDGKLKLSQIGSDVSTRVLYEYDNLRNMTCLNDPSCGTIHYEYDAFGNLLKTVKPDGGIIACTYSSSGEILSRTIDDGIGDVIDTQWIYDSQKGKMGMLKSVVHGKSYVVNYNYDGMLRLISVNTNIAGTDYLTRFEYDDAGRECRKTYPSGFTTEKCYSNSGFCRSIRDVDDDKLLWNTDDSDATGNITNFKIGNGLQTELGYDSDFKYLTSIRTHYDERDYQNLKYTYDDFGNLINRAKYTDKMVSESFGYDAFNRLVDIEMNGVNTGHMEYDDYGNMISKTIDGVDVFYDADYEGDNPYSIKNAMTDAENLDGLSHQIKYTAFDKISSASNDYALLKFDYGSDLKRVTMICECNGVDMRKTYVDDCEYVSANSDEYVDTFLDGPMGIFAVIRINKDGEKSVFYIHKDHLGSWCMITDEDADVVQKTSYDAWGNLRDEKTWSADYTGELMFDRGFTGHEHIVALGIINMEGRLYDPMLSMMLSPDNYVQDPYFSQNYNRYRYCYNNPLSYNDPTGDVAEWLIQGIFWGAMNVISHIDDIDNFGEGLLLFGAGFVSGVLTQGLGECSWCVQVVCGVGSAVIKAGVNNYVAQNDGSFNWDAIDKSSLKEDVMYALGYGLASSMLNAYIVYPEGEEPGVSLGTLICSDYKKGHILDTTVSSLMGRLFTDKLSLDDFDLSDLNIDWAAVLPEVIDALAIYYPDSQFIKMLDGLGDWGSFYAGIFGGSSGGNDGGGKGSIVNAARPYASINNASLNSPLCYSNVRSLILNK